MPGCRASTILRCMPSPTATAGSDAATLTRFIASYQTVKTLRLGELWAIPIMLRLALIENLRRVAARVAASLSERELAVTLGRPHDRGRRARPEEPDPRRCRHGAFGAADDGAIRRRTVAPPSWPQHRAGAAADLGRAASRPKATRRSSSWCSSRRRAQAAAQVSVSNSIGSLRLARLDGLARVRRDAVQGRPGAAPRSGRCLSAHGLRDPRQLSPRGRAHRPPQRCGRGRGGQRRGATGARRGGTAGSCEPIARMSATTSSTQGRSNWSARSRCARRLRTACAAPWRAARSPGSPARSSRHAAARAAAAGDRVAGLRRAVDGAAARRVGRGGRRRRAAAVGEPARGGHRQLVRADAGASRGRCRAWTFRSASRTHRAPWWWCRRCCRASRASTHWPRRSRCASSPTGTHTCISRC